MAPKVLNLHDMKLPADETNVYIGRDTIRKNGEWGNPFVIGKDGDRNEVVRKHAEWFLSQPELVEKAKKELKGKNLVCFCAPRSCHGDILLRIANE